MIIKINKRICMIKYILPVYIFRRRNSVTVVCLGWSRRLTTTFQSGQLVLVGQTRGVIFSLYIEIYLPAVTSGPMTSHLFYANCFYF